MKKQILILSMGTLISSIAITHENTKEQEDNAAKKEMFSKQYQALFNESPSAEIWSKLNSSCGGGTCNGCKGGCGTHL